MAAKKKKKVKKVFIGKSRNPSDQRMYRDLIDAMLGAVVNVVRLYDTRVRGQLRFEIDEEVDE